MTRKIDDMISVLNSVKELLARSVASDWAALTPTEVIAILDRELKSLTDTGELHNKTELDSLFVVTAEIQEIAMASGWGKKYLLLASQFDNALEAFV